MVIVFSMGRCFAMISYVRQVAICESVRETIRQALSRSDDPGVRQKTRNIPPCDSILRTVSLNQNLDTEEKLIDFITEHMVNGLRLTAAQKEQLTVQNDEAGACPT